MGVRYIFNTSGEYVAFITNNYLFNPDGDWLGVITNGNELYNSDGLFIGIVLDDDRIVWDKSLSVPKRIPRPPRPPRPARPMRPLRRLRMFKYPYPYEDIFEVTKGKVNKLVPRYELQQFDHLIGAQIIAEDDTSLGIISKNRFDPNSILNTFGDYGSKFSPISIFNEFGPYGGEFSPMSPFNKFCNTPPKIIRNNEILGYLTVNQFISKSVDTYQFVAWLNTL